MLVEDSVQDVTDEYWYTYDRNQFYFNAANLGSYGLDFDADGVCRFAYGGPFIGIVRRGEGGTLTGMVYLVPEELWYPNEITSNFRPRPTDPTLTLSTSD